MLNSFVSLKIMDPGVVVVAVVEVVLQISNDRLRLAVNKLVPMFPGVSSPFITYLDSHIRQNAITFL